MILVQAFTVSLTETTSFHNCYHSLHMNSVQELLLPVQRPTPVAAMQIVLVLICDHSYSSYQSSVSLVNSSQRQGVIGHRDWVTPIFVMNSLTQDRGQKRTLQCLSKLSQVQTEKFGIQTCDVSSLHRNKNLFLKENSGQIYNLYCDLKEVYSPCKTKTKPKTTI